MRWLDPDWRTEAETWIREQVRVTGPIEQPHVHPWSTVMRVPTAQGVVWFKASAPDVHGFEPRLTEILAEARPDAVTELIATDRRGWMLMRDAGARLRDLEESPVEHWERILPRYAELQIAVTPRAEELLELGVPDERPAGIPDRVAALIEDEEALMIGRSAELTAEQRDELRRRLPELQALVEELESFGVPPTIQHDDLHDGQVFVDDDRYRVLDWGDSCVSHPFHTLTVTLRALAWRAVLEPGSALLLRLRDAYLEPFGAPPAAADLAYRTGTLARALAWLRYIRATPPGQRDPEDAESVPYGLRLYLEAGPIGTWE
ncbi:MAG TPA: phosphotransferase [Gaiellaceae bacterium]|nr:phosphotransferase [Gaiellaceae bacterium]HET8651541.1 phosphotransferase [Gaiellaceae bacterium]